MQITLRPPAPTAPPAGQPLPRVSVVVPCYNYGRFLPACVGSILSQTGVEADVLIVDDASPDGSGEVAESLATGRHRVRVIRHTTNQGHIATYNEGLARVEGDYVALLSADDLLTPGSLQRATQLMQAHPEVGLVYGHPRTFTEPTPPEADLHERGWTVWTGPEWVRAQCRRGLSCIYSPEALARTRVLHAVGGYSDALPHSADLEMWLRIAAVACVGRINGPDQAFRRLHPHSMMHTHFGSAGLDLLERWKAYHRFFEGPGRRLPDASACEALCRRRVAQEAVDLACEVLDREGDGPVVEQLAALAREVAQAGEAPRWIADIQRRKAGPLSWTARWVHRVHDWQRNLEGRLRWRRWRWFGI